MEKTLKNLAQVSLIFLVIFGGLHISSSFLVAEGSQNRIILILFNTLDLPFLLAALIYGCTRLATAIGQMNGNARNAFLVCSVFSAIIFCAALYLNFALPDAKLF